MPYRTGRHNRRQLIYRLLAELPADTPADDPRWTLALVITDPELDAAAVVDALNIAERWRLLHLYVPTADEPDATHVEPRSAR